MSVPHVLKKVPESKQSILAPSLNSEKFVVCKHSTNEHLRVRGMYASVYFKLRSKPQLH